MRTKTITMKMPKISSLKARNVINNYLLDLTNFYPVKLRTEYADDNYFLVVDCIEAYNVIYWYPISQDTYINIRMHVNHVMRFANYMNNKGFLRDNSF